MLSDAFQHQHRAIIRRMPQHFIVDSESTSNIILFLKALAHHQAGMQTNLIGSTAGVDLFEKLRCLNQSLLAFFRTFIERLATFVRTADQIKPCSKVLGFRFQTPLKLCFVFLFINELRECIVDGFVLILSRLVDHLRLIHKGSGGLLQLQFLAGLLYFQGLPHERASTLKQQFPQHRICKCSLFMLAVFCNEFAKRCFGF